MNVARNIFGIVYLLGATANITLIVILLIAFEISLGLLFIIKRKYLRIALTLGILFCLASMPTMVQAIYTNLPLALIQAFLLWKELRGDAAVKNTQNNL